MDSSYSRLACLVSDFTLVLILQNSWWYFLSLVPMYLVHSLCFFFMSITAIDSHYNFPVRTIPDWNSLPAAAIESKTVAAFKSQLVD